MHHEVGLCPAMTDLLTPADWAALWITLRLALLTTLLLLGLGLPLAWWLARGRGPLRVGVEAVVALPLVLPPTVLGFYLLLALGPQGFPGAWWEALGLPRLVFSFPGLVLASLVYSLPFVVQPLTTAFRGLDDGVLDAASALGAGPLDRFRSIVLPQSRAGILAAAVLGFAHTVGEFGVVLMIGGNIPGETQVLSIAIYDQVESLAYGRAHMLSGLLLAGSLLLLLLVYGSRARKEARL